VKVCGSCQRLFADDGSFCPVDGNKLSELDRAPLPADEEDPRIGSQLLGRYTIYRKVADGGMGRVYQALDATTNRSVALKILHPEVAVDDVSLERFRREFEVSSNLPHDHIVEVLGFERTQDRAYLLVMEYLEGEELRMLLKRDKVLPPERVIRMLSQTALGLAAAHERKVVHRDLKPDNLFLCHTAEGDVCKILDFGSVRDNSENAKKLTVMGTTIGSPYYMSPEQAQGLPSLDHRADVWSAAAIAYECLTGKVPFPGRTGPSILLAILSNDPEPPSVAGKEHGVPATLDEVIEHALAKNPDLRFASMAELADGFGRAYGLDGSHQDWARTAESTLRRLIAEGLPRLIAARADSAPKLDMKSLDDAFRAGSEGGPSKLPDDLVIMGLPTRPPWFWPLVLGGGASLLLLVILLLATR
jgi:serine/threonine protein kinase